MIIVLHTFHLFSKFLLLTKCHINRRVFIFLVQRFYIMKEKHKNRTKLKNIPETKQLINLLELILRMQSTRFFAKYLYTVKIVQIYGMAI